ncbi:nuclear transport factor 2 family protein [Sphingomicrobium lutaoense]|uniref:DUF4440 domain-containing protein n=1 Tax=Sphingomicrobium lutaoense TaxID=515949 RepID=A0A839Z2B2_9SPHN|nr:nuclear transport factor 2 family protein [Sphingomicrobium lutaoense]MBB3763893.1 hypothetical protein [Sphingomicrobium lutaoense]
MADFQSSIEAAEHSLMRAWQRGDRRQMKALLHRDFRLVVGARPSQLLDRASWLQSVGETFSNGAYRFDDVYVRRHGKSALFAARAELELNLQGEEWSGLFWLVDLWRKGGLRRNWRLSERILSRPEADEQVPAALRELQLWR